MTGFTRSDGDLDGIPKGDKENLVMGGHRASTQKPSPSSAADDRWEPIEEFGPGNPLD